MLSKSFRQCNIAFKNCVFLSLRFRSSCNSNLTILNNGSLYSSKSLLISTQNERYLINCGEGTQKILIENGLKLSSIRNVLLTQCNPETSIGITAIAFSLLQNGSNKLRIHGLNKWKFPVILLNTFDMLNIKLIHHSANSFEDTDVKINSFSYKSSLNYDTVECSGYLFTLKPEIKQSIDEANLKRNRHIYNYKKGNDSEVSAMYGNISPLLKVDVGNDKFLVIDCPSMDHVDSLTKALPVDKFNDEDGKLRTVIHLVDKSAFYLDWYQEFVRQLNRLACSSPLTHVVIDRNPNLHISHRTYYLQTCLNRFFDEKMFPKLQMYEDYFVHKEQDAAEQTRIDNIESSLVTFPELLQKLPFDTINDPSTYTSEMWSFIKNMNEESIVEKVLDQNAHVPSEIMREKMQELKDKLAAVKESLEEQNSGEYPNVTFLGTSSSTPSTYRNITSILLETSPDLFVLFDCGEGTLDRILTLYGHDRGNEVIRNIRLICISHFHLDHHSGLYTLLRYREQLTTTNNCLILAARDVDAYIRGIDSIFQTAHCLYQASWCNIDLLQIRHNRKADDYRRTTIDAFEEKYHLNINPARVRHSGTSYGFVISSNHKELKDQWKITFSGDCIPGYDDLLKAGMGSDLLIHEATYDDGMEEMAARKYHSTVGQAIEQGIKMRAKFTMLTHFSSRHPLVPPVEDQYTNVAQAFDFLRVTLTSCQYLKVLDPYLEFLFPQHWHELMTKRQKLMRINAKSRMG